MEGKETVVDGTPRMTPRDVLAPQHYSRFVIRYLAAGLFVAYNAITSSILPVLIPPNTVFLLIAIYVAVVALLAAAIRRNPGSRILFNLLLAADLTALFIGMPSDSFASCPSLVVLILVVLDAGFRSEGRMFLPALALAGLTGVAVIAIRAYALGPTFAAGSAWTLGFSMFICLYGYSLLEGYLQLRQRLSVFSQLADDSDDLIFTVLSPETRIGEANSATRMQTQSDKASLESVFAVRKAQANLLVDEALRKGQAVRQWSLASSGALIEIKARPMFTDDGLRRLACTGRDISSHHQRADKLLEQSRSDALTGLPNRRAFDERLELEWRRMRREEAKLGLLMVDIDHFKKYNDRYGHPEGDRAIQEVAEIIRHSLRRAGDFVARYGGEEFVIVSPMTTTTDVKALGNLLLNMVAEKRIAHVDNPAQYLTISVGAAALIPTSDYGQDLLLEQADAALYDAKHRGRNRVVVAREFEPEMFTDDSFPHQI